jgi:hypothetical protein
MNYYNLKSILSARKQIFHVCNPSPSFATAGGEAKPYIEPTFQKVVFEAEKPTIILVSAVGATGKTALAEQLSRDLQLPLLDLAKHKPVGDNTLTGILTHAFDVKDLTNVFAGLAAGEYGVIIDGIDEGRSKTTEKAFEAFLDDIVTLCKATSPTTFLLLGRTQILDDCWYYLAESGIPTALVTILPFTVAEAKQYIDTFTTGAKGPYAVQYRSARDSILEKLGRVFAGDASQKPEAFLSFIGYPPVLDAIVTLLTDEENYHKVLKDLEAQDGQNVEVSLLNRIAQYVLLRERDSKVNPNILQPLLKNVPDSLRQHVLAEAFSVEEQCVRLVAHCLGRQLMLGRLSEAVLDEKYEEGLATWLPEHPFLSGRQFRNAVFEALALATLIVSRTEDNFQLLDEYLRSHKPSYHLVYMLDIASKDHCIPLEALGPLFTAAMEFRSVRSLVELRVDGPDWDSDAYAETATGEIEIGIEIILGEEKNDSQAFEFQAEITSDSHLVFGSRLGGAFISVPCSVQFRAAQELELAAPVEITAKSVSLEAKELILRSSHHSKSSQEEVFVEAGRLDAHLETITTNGVPLVFSLADSSGVSYPTIQYTQKATKPQGDPLFQQKYFRLKRILMAFRSHSKGALARYRYKIEHQRVLKNETGQAVLNKLVNDGILQLRGSFYYLDPEKLGSKIGVSWQDLRKGSIPEPLEKYIGTIS